MTFQSVIAKYDYVATIEDELSVRKNERLMLLNDSSLWWTVKNSEGAKGLVPSNFLKKMKPTIFDSLRSLSRKKDEKQKPSHCLSRSCNSITSEDYSFNITLQPFNVIVKYAYCAQNSDEMDLIAGEEITVREKNINGWWKGESIKTNKIGWFPSNYIIPTINNSKIDFSQPNSAINESTETCQLPRNVTTIFKYSAEQVGELSFLENEPLELIDRRSDSSDGWWKARNSHGIEGFVHQVYFTSIEAEDEGQNDVFKTLTSKSIDIENQSNNIPLSISCNSTDLSISNLTDCSKLNEDLDANEILNSCSNEINIALSRLEERHHMKEDIVADAYVNREWYRGSIGRVESENLLLNNDEGSFLVRNCLSKAGDYTLVMRIRQGCKHFRIENISDNFHIGKQTFETLDHLITFYLSHPIYQLEDKKICLGHPCKNL